MNIPPLWKNKDYMLLWAGQIISTLGTTASTIVYPLLILGLTGSPTIAGGVAAMHAVPYLLFCLPAGALIDRWDRKRVMILCNLGRAIAVLSIPIALWLDALTVWQIYVVAFMEGSFFVFFNLAEVAALPRVVPVHSLPQAAAQNEAAFGAIRIAGPSFGTFLFQVIGKGAPFIANAICYVLSVISLFLIKTEFRIGKVGPRSPIRTEVVEGIHWIWNMPLIRYLAFLTGGLNLVHAATPLVVIVLAKEMGAQAIDIGLIFSIGGIGGILGALIGGQVQKRFRFGQVIVFTIWIQALSFFLYAFVSEFFLLGVVYAMISMMVPVYNVVQFSHRLTLIPDGLQGRINSTFRLVAFGFTPVGAILSGLLLEQIGAKLTIILLGTSYLLLATTTSFNRQVQSAMPAKQAT
jgi:predicted MFS family arabinose efflux permease